MLGACDTLAPAASDAGFSDRAPPTDVARLGPAGAPGIPFRADAGMPLTMLAELQADLVQRSQVARNVLYSWTTDRQVAELRATPTLLTRSESSSGVRTNLSSTLTALADMGDPMAKLLSSAPFRKGRYAWANAWATLLGWPDESYGNQLLRITLKPQAWIVTLQAGQFAAVDMQNLPIDMATVLASPERIGAVYFINEGASGPRACGSFSSGCATGAYREYFVNNEQMVEEWSLASEPILAEIQRSIALVQRLRDQIAGAAPASDACELSRAAFCSWAYGESYPSVPPGYLLALALSSEFYLPTLQNADNLLSALRACVFTPDPFVHNP
jgi:hypothetical protein